MLLKALIVLCLFYSLSISSTCYYFLVVCLVQAVIYLTQHVTKNA
jgi:hypothetical protein